MTLPFTAEQFFGVFAAYNAAIWPAQVVAYALGLGVIGLLLRPRRSGNRAILAVLALFWVWMGAAYHIGHFAAINPAAYGFGAVFILEGVAFGIAAALRPDLAFRLAARPAGALAGALIVYAIAVYEVLGSAAGHGMMAGPLFGVAPCPTAIFTLGVLSTAARPVPWWLMVVPAAWAIVGTGAALYLNVPEDYALLPAALIAVAASLGLWYRRRSRTAPA